MKIAILNYNIGNLSSVKNALDTLGVQARIISNANEVGKFDKLILPGVGAFGDAMAHLRQSGMDEAIKDFAKSGKYLLGICLGMQLLFTKSYEFGEFRGLDLLQGEVVKFQSNSLKIPQMGWNRIEIVRDCVLLSGIQNGAFLYFVHSFYVPKNPYCTALCEYGESFSAIVQKENIFGIQPHPEKSAESGLKILQNFINLK